MKYTNMMKKILLFIFLLSAVLTIQAQDKLITQSGDVKIFYTVQKDENAPVLQIAKKDVMMMLRADGTKQILSDETSAPATGSKPETTAEVLTSTLQNRHPIVWKNEPYTPIDIIDEAEKAKNKKANQFVMIYRPKDGSMLEDDNVRMIYRIVESDPDRRKSYEELIAKYGNDGETLLLSACRNCLLSVTLQNKTNRTIYIDLGNTFIKRGNTSEVYYIPTATSTTQGSTTGSSVNLGVSGVVGGSSSKISSTTTYSQRVLAIPPLSSVTLDGKILFPAGGESIYNNFYYLNSAWGNAVYLHENYRVKSGQTLIYEDSKSPINFSFFTTYSLNESCLETAFLQSDVCVKQIVGIQYKPALWQGQKSKIEGYNKSASSDWSKYYGFFVLY